MNLHGMTRPYVTQVNPDIDATLIKSTGYTRVNYQQVPTYSSAPVRIQVQGVTPSSLQHMDALNIQGVLRQVHMYGNTAGVVRPDATGGDLLNFPQALGADIQTWKVVEVSETFPDWCSLVVQLQTELVTP